MSATVSTFVIMLLAGWTLLGFYLARRAEAQATHVRPPFPWFAIVTVAGVVVAALASTASPAAVAAYGFASVGVVIAADSDARSGYLFDAVTFPTAVLTIFAVIAAGTTFEAACGVSLLVGTFGAIVVLSKGRLMGLGDVKAMFAIGAAFGPFASIIAIFTACLSGIVYCSLTRRLHRDTRLHFGPHLATGSAVTLLAGNHALHLGIGL